MANKKSRERELAAQLFINTDISQKEIAQRLSISEKTISAWAAEDNWDNLKMSHESTNAKTLTDMRLILQKLVEKKKSKIEDDSFSKNDSDAILELAKSIDILEGEIPLRMRVQILEEFMDFIPHDEMKLKTELADYQTKYLLHKSRG